jgi:hypothetical protein
MTGRRVYLYPYRSARRAPILPTICPQLQSSPMNSGDELPLLERVFTLPARPVKEFNPSWLTSNRPTRLSQAS